MKEYKVIRPMLGLRNRMQKLEDLLNSYAAQGWSLKNIDDHYSYIIFERDKNR
ncbi:DUF4177 domain-containing protein [Sungkyunkwania multivorans]|uniref:DUF4177 domain-containing protein n=1 Tax=Sungkyunkwania multivorans TaxID=1173618 RepID=A0ABW3CWW4_9FLAO